MISEETKEPLEMVKERLFKASDILVNASSSSLIHNDGGGDGINGKGISFKPDERPLLGPISPYFRHLTRQSLREAQRHYREHERLRPNSKLEVCYGCIICMFNAFHCFNIFVLFCSHPPTCKKNRFI